MINIIINIIIKIKINIPIDYIYILKNLQSLIKLFN